MSDLLILIAFLVLTLVSLVCGVWIGHDHALRHHQCSHFAGLECHDITNGYIGRHRRRDVADDIRLYWANRP